MDKIIMIDHKEGKSIDIEKEEEENKVQILQIQMVFLLISLEDLDSILS